MKELLDQILAYIARAARDFVELLRAPRAHGAKGKLFRTTRFTDALIFLAVSVVVTMLLKGSASLEAPQIYYDLARDTLWKFAFVLLEAAVITGVWWLLKGPAQFLNYVVANCFYFAVLSVIGRTGLLILHSLGWSYNASFASHRGPWILGIVMGVGIGAWACISWGAYADHNKAVGNRRWLSLALVLVGSAPVLAIIWVLRRALGLGQSAPF